MTNTPLSDIHGPLAGTMADFASACQDTYLIFDAETGGPAFGDLNGTAPTAPAQPAQDADQDAWHITSGSFVVESAAGPREVGPGCVVIPEARYQALLAAYRAQPAQDSLTEAAPFRIRITPDMTCDQINAAAAAEEAHVDALTETRETLQWLLDQWEGDGWVTEQEAMAMRVRDTLDRLSAARAAQPVGEVVDALTVLRKIAAPDAWSVPTLDPDEEFGIAPENHYRVTISLEDMSIGWGATFSEAADAALRSGEVR